MRGGGYNDNKYDETKSNILLGGVINHTKNDYNNYDIVYQETKMDGYLFLDKNCTYKFSNDINSFF